MRFVDLSHVLADGMPAMPGVPVPEIGLYWTHESSEERYGGLAAFYLNRVSFVGGVGTYLDSPFHRFAEGVDIAGLPLEALARVPGIVLDARAVRGHEPVEVQVDPAVLTGKAVLFRTGWDRLWGSDDYWQPGPYVGPRTVDVLLEARPLLVGVDFVNVDNTDDPARPVHTRLLGAGILVVEHLCNLAALPVDGFRFYAVPLRVQGGASLPVRAFAELE